MLNHDAERDEQEERWQGENSDGGPHDTITLQREVVDARVGCVWTATFGGPCAARIQELFGGTTLPTPYRANMPAGIVLDRIRAKNPDSEVCVGDEA